MHRNRNSVVSFCDFFRSRRKFLYRHRDPPVEKADQDRDQRNHEQQHQQKQIRRSAHFLPNGISVIAHRIIHLIRSEIHPMNHRFIPEEPDLAAVHGFHIIKLNRGCVVFKQQFITAEYFVSLALPYRLQRFEDPLVVQFHEQHRIGMKTVIHDIPHKIDAVPRFDKDRIRVDLIGRLPDSLLTIGIKISLTARKICAARKVNTVRHVGIVKTGEPVVLIEFVLFFQQTAGTGIQVSFISVFKKLFINCAQLTVVGNILRLCDAVAETQCADLNCFFGRDVDRPLDLRIQTAVDHSRDHDRN